MTRSILFLAGTIAVFGQVQAPPAPSETYIKTLPEDAEKTAFVREVLAMAGLHNDVRVVKDPKAKGWCAYAATVNGRQVIGIDETCVPRLRSAMGYDWFAVGVLMHEVGHLLAGHTINAANSHREESEADEWVGWAMRRFGASLEDARTFALELRPDSTPTHPARTVRVASVERGWRNAGGGDAISASSSPGVPGINWWTRLMQTPVRWPWN